MAGYSNAVVMGNLTRKPELKYLPSGSPVCEFTVAVNRTWNDKSGAKQEKVSFIDCKCFGKTAETIDRFFDKGKPILVDGRIEQDRWEDQSGQKRSRVYINVTGFAFVADGNKGGNRDTDELPPLPPRDQPPVDPEYEPTF